jgi:hypothetical protein
MRFFIHFFLFHSIWKNRKRYTSALGIGVFGTYMLCSCQINNPWNRCIPHPEFPGIRDFGGIPIFYYYLFGYPHITTWLRMKRNPLNKLNTNICKSTYIVFIFVKILAIPFWNPQSPSIKII